MKSSPWLVLLAALCVGGSSPAQTPQTAPYHAMDGTPGRVRYDWATQSWELLGTARRDRVRRPGRGGSLAGGPGRPGRGSTTPGQAKALVNCFSNTRTNGFFSVQTTGTEWMDWASKNEPRYGGKSGLVGRFAFRYATNALGPSRPGGTGASLGLSFYAGTTGFCSRGQVVPYPGNPPYFLGPKRIFPPDEARFAFTGLPGATGSQVSPGFTVTVNLPDNRPFCWPDGKVGWAFTGIEPSIGSTQNLTGPLLTDWYENTCWSDAFDLWSRPDEFGTCAGVFFFGSCVPPLVFAVPPPCAGFYIRVWEEDGSQPATSTMITHPANLTSFFEVQGANVAHDWVTQVNLDFFGKGQVASFVRVFAGPPIPAGIPLSILDAGTRLLCSPPVIGSNELQTISLPDTTTTHSIPVPADLTLIGLDLCAQAFGVAVGPLSIEGFNALSITIGSTVQ